MMSGNMLGSGQGGGLMQFLSGMFGNSGAPYQAGMDQLLKYFQMAQGTQNPFLQMGTSAIPQYQSWLQGMSDPSKFINTQMQNYQQSPWNSFLQRQAMNAGNAQASASGLAGSSPMAMQMQQNATNLASSGMNDWLGHVLGINQQYGAGLGNEIGMGQHSADMLTQLMQGMGNQMASGAYGQQAGQNQDFMNMLGGGLNMFLNGIF